MLKLLKLFGRRRKKITKKDSITGRNNSFPVPYLSKLEGNKLQGGQSLIVRGIIIEKTDFVINLTSGSGVEFDSETKQLDDRLLCMRVEMEPSRKVHLNAHINGEWGQEGVVKHNWKCGDEFDVRIRCQEDEFEIFIDHSLVARFAHYVPLSQISHIYINGGIELYSVSWEGRSYMMPYTADVPGNFYPGRKLYTSGLMKKRAKQFCLELQSSSNIAFRFSAIFKFSSKKITCNSKIDGIWGNEEKVRLEQFPFKRRSTFDLLVYCEETQFIIYLDDCLIGKFNHRLTPDTIDRLSITGDIILFGVHLK